MPPDHYEILGVSHSASHAQIKRAFRQRALACHPDRGGSNHQMKRLNEAWRVLGDPGERRAYDATLLPPEPPPASAARPIGKPAAPGHQTLGSELAALARQLAFHTGKAIGGVFRLLDRLTGKRKRRPVRGK